MGSPWLTRLLVALGIVAVCWAAVVGWLTVADSRHREFYAGPGVRAEVNPAGNLHFTMPIGSYLGPAIPGIHSVTVGVLAASGIALLAAGLRVRRQH